jgi:hypothetical protein
LLSLVLCVIHYKQELWSSLTRDYWTLIGLWAVFSSLCPQGRLQLGPEVTHCQFVQGDHICCCFYLASPYYCNSVWSAPPLARWGSSALSTTLSPIRLALGSTMACFGRLSCHPTPTLSLCCFSNLHSLRVQLLAHPVLWSRFSIQSHPHCQY